MFVSFGSHLRSPESSPNGDDRSVLAYDRHTGRLKARAFWRGAAVPQAGCHR